MSTVPDPRSIRRPEMIDNQEKHTVFLKPLITSSKIEAGEFTYHNDSDDPTLFETRNVLYTAGPEKLIIGRFCAIAMGAQFLMSAANHPRSSCCGRSGRRRAARMSWRAAPGGAGAAGIFLITAAGQSMAGRRRVLAVLGFPRRAAPLSP